MEDVSEDERKELLSKIDSLESIVRMLELKTKNSHDHGTNAIGPSSLPIHNSSLYSRVEDFVLLIYVIYIYFCILFCDSFFFFFFFLRGKHLLKISLASGGNISAKGSVGFLRIKGLTVIYFQCAKGGSWEIGEGPGTVVGVVYRVQVHHKYFLLFFIHLLCLIHYLYILLLYVRFHL